MKELVFKQLELFRRKLVQQDQLVFLIFLKASSRLFHCNTWKSQTKKTSRGQPLYIGKLLKKMKNSGRGGRKGKKKTNETAAQEHRATLTATVLTTS